MKHTEETKKSLSDNRKKYLKNNPDKHPWKMSKKFISAPCEELKRVLREHNISFVEEFQPLYPDRFFSLDISFPEDKIGIEVNGNQHYNKDMSLKDYYLTRHNMLMKSGWEIIECHYSLVYKDEYINTLITNIKNKIKNYDYTKFVKIKIKQPNKTCQNCGNILYKNNKSGRCLKCAGKMRAKFIIKREKLEELLINNTYTKIGEMFGVSGATVCKTCKKFNLIGNTIGKWQKEKSILHNIPEEQFRELLSTKSYSYIIDKYKCARNTIDSVAQNYNIIVKKYEGSPDLTEDEMSHIKDLHNLGYSNRKICKIIKRSRKCIDRYIKTL